MLPTPTPDDAADASFLGPGRTASEARGILVSIPLKSVWLLECTSISMGCAMDLWQELLGFLHLGRLVKPVNAVAESHD